MKRIMFVHATRKYELSAILRGRDLLQEEDVYEVIRRRRDADLSLQRKATSEGRIPLGTESKIIFVIGRSNIMDTFGLHGNGQKGAQSPMFFGCWFLPGAEGIPKALHIELVIPQLALGSKMNLEPACVVLNDNFDWLPDSISVVTVPATVASNDGSSAGSSRCLGYL